MKTDNSKVNINLLKENEALKQRIVELDGVLKRIIESKNNSNTTQDLFNVLQEIDKGNIYLNN